MTFKPTQWTQVLHECWTKRAAQRVAPAAENCPPAQPSTGSATLLPGTGPICKGQEGWWGVIIVSFHLMYSHIACYIRGVLVRWEAWLCSYDVCVVCLYDSSVLISIFELSLANCQTASWPMWTATMWMEAPCQWSQAPDQQHWTGQPRQSQPFQGRTGSLSPGRSRAYN